MKALREKFPPKRFPRGSAAPPRRARASGGHSANPLRCGERIFFFLPLTGSASSFAFCTLFVHFRDYYIWGSLFSPVAFQVSNMINLLSTELSVSFTPEYDRWCVINESPLWRRNRAVNGAAKCTGKFTSFWKCKLLAGFESVYLLPLLFP